jgi:hypothetical protein
MERSLSSCGCKPGPPNKLPDVPAAAAAAFDPSDGAWTGQQLIVVIMDDESGDTPQVEVLSLPVRKSRHQRP